jgi:anti-sigma B factor antagonist
MDINERRDGGVIVLQPSGRIDNDTSLAFQDRLLQLIAEGSTLVDFSGVEFISSAGLAALMTAAKQAKAAKIRIACAGLNSVVQETFAISRFARVVPVYPTAAEAVAALKA